ncbi:MAG: hypothetical protein U1F52_03465 [Burkholderiales bacterium]
MLQQVLRRDGHAGTCEVGRASDHEPPIPHQPGGDERRIGQRSQPQRKVMAAAAEILDRIGQRKTKMHLGVRRDEVRQQRRKNPSPEAGRRRDANRAGGVHDRRGDGRFRFGDVVQDALAVARIAFALVGQGTSASRPLQQPHAQASFEGVDALADHRDRHGQFARRGREAAVSRDRQQRTHVREQIHDGFNHGANLV